MATAYKVRYQGFSVFARGGKAKWQPSIDLYRLYRGGRRRRQPKIDLYPLYRGPEQRWGGVHWEKELLKEKEKAKISDLRREKGQPVPGPIV